MKLDAKTIAAAGALVATLTGAVELRVQVGAMASRLDRIEALLYSVPAVGGRTADARAHVEGE